MNAALKVGLPIVLLVAIVFGVTVISQNTLPQKPTAPTADATVSGPPLVPEIAWQPNERGVPTALLHHASEPKPDDRAGLEKRAFPGLFEMGTGMTASYWFANPHAVPVKVVLRGRSCSSCTDARVGVLPPTAARDAVARVGAAAFVPPAGLLAPDLLGPLVGLAAERTLTWQPLDFDKPDAPAVVPAAADGVPARGVFQTIVQVKSGEAVSREVTVDLTAGGGGPVTTEFRVAFTGMGPFAVHPRDFPLGDMPEAMPPARRDLYVWSATRGFDGLPPPAVAVVPADPFVAVGAPVALAPDELARLAADFGGQYPVRAAYRLPVTVHRKAPDPKPGEPTEPDYGPFERRIQVATAGGTAPPTAVLGTVTGLVAVEGGKRADLGDFNARFGDVKTFPLVADRPGVEVALLAEETRPDFLKVTVAPAEPAGDRARWSVRVEVPPGQAFGQLPADSGVTLRATTPAGPKKVRIPLTGNGYSRGR